jgi:hypothetical protein
VINIFIGSFFLHASWIGTSATDQRFAECLHFLNYILMLNRTQTKKQSDRAGRRSSKSGMLAGMPFHAVVFDFHQQVRNSMPVIGRIDNGLGGQRQSGINRN